MVRRSWAGVAAWSEVPSVQGIDGGCVMLIWGVSM